MDVQVFSYTSERGWSVPSFPRNESGNGCAGTLVLVFGAPGYFNNEEPFQALQQAYPGAAILGCSTAGEILNDEIIDDSLVVAVAAFASTRLRLAVSPVDSGEKSFAAGRVLAQDLNDPDLQGMLVLSDGLHVNGSELIKGLNSGLPESVVVTGGLAGDGDRFEHTWVLHNGRPDEKYVTAVGFYGDDILISHGSRGGWDIFGPERRVTRSEGNVLYELDGQPALKLYKEYLGERASELPASALLFPLSLRTGADEEKSVVRTVLSIDEYTQTMTFAGDLPEGSLVQLMRANFDRLIDGAVVAAETTAKRMLVSGSDSLAIAISCVGRRLVLGERAEEEVESTLEAFPAGTRQAGFYSYGEISPWGIGRCDLHNQTMTLTMISEAGV